MGISFYRRYGYIYEKGLPLEKKFNKIKIVGFIRFLVLFWDWDWAISINIFLLIFLF